MMATENYFLSPNKKHYIKAEIFITFPCFLQDKYKVLVLQKYLERYLQPKQTLLKMRFVDRFP